MILADPEGSSLHNAVLHGVCYTSQQSERGLRKHRYDSIVEGIGLDRLTENFQLAMIDSSEKVSDQEALEMAHWIFRHEGLFLGSSSAINLVATCRSAWRLSEGSHLVTVVCDLGSRHLSRFWNPDYVRNTQFGSVRLTWPEPGCVPACLQDLH